MGKARKFAIGAALLGAAGYVAGMLTAPKSGRETRDEIRKITGKGLTEAEKELKGLHSELEILIKDVQKNKNSYEGKAHKELTNILEKSKDTREKAKEIFSALHEGEAEDKDLRKAIKDANASLEHLRDFMKK